MSITLRPLLFTALAIAGLLVRGQQDASLLAREEGGHRTSTALPIVEGAALDRYEAYNRVLAGDSVRPCNGFPCIGWVEDHHPDGSLLHRGFYDNGQLVIYKNYHPNGQLEREFKSVDDLRSMLRTYQADGQLLSEARFIDGVSIEYTEYHPNGRLRYHEEKHRREPYYIHMDLYAEDGRPVSTLELVDRKNIEFDLHEYHPNGQPSESGHARYDPNRMDTRRIGTWLVHDEQGRLIREDHYVDGKVNDSRNY